MSAIQISDLKGKFDDCWSQTYKKILFFQNTFAFRVLKIQTANSKLPSLGQKTEIGS